jgi:glycosyltransferase involved in cell wall biosynthesis
VKPHEALTSGVLVSHPVHQHAYETAVAAQDAGNLRWFATGLYDTGRGLADPRLRTWLPAGTQRRIERELRRRRHPELDPNRVLTIPRFHLLATGFRRSLGQYSCFRRLDFEIWAQQQFDVELGKRLAGLNGIELVHAFEGAALATFQSAKGIGKKTILDVPSAHERFMALEGKAPQPRVAQERSLADILLAPSDYVVECLTEAGVPGDRIIKIPYGVDPDSFKRDASLRKDDVFRAIFVGRIGRRKGVSYLLEAWRRLDLPNAELLLVGEPDEEGRRLLRRYEGLYRFVGPHPKYEVHRFFQQSDVFVFPSLAEGSAYVTYEALASELPIITTPNSGSVIRDGIDGLLIPVRDIEALEERLALLHADPALRRTMGLQGRELIERKYTWRHYYERVGQVHRQMLERMPATAPQTIEKKTPS